MFDYLIIGCGLSGSVLAERLASQLDKQVLIIDKRNHIGGNVFDYRDHKGVLIHKYGPHIFHTNSARIIDYLTLFTSWEMYNHTVLAYVDGKMIPLPFNLNSLKILFSENISRKYENKLIGLFGFGNKIYLKTLLESENTDIKTLGKFIYEKIFLGYNLKQWEVEPENLDEKIISRLPILINKDNRYFNDKYQMLPADGYTKLIERMLNHKNIKIMLQTQFSQIENTIKFNRLIYTGAIDEYFDFQYGPLPYRSLDFQFQEIDQEYYQEVAQVNYPNEYNFTRITEFKHFYKQKSNSSTICFEYPKRYIDQIEQIPFYPIPSHANEIIFNKYISAARKLRNVYFCGRLGDYSYYNMDQVVARSLSIFEKEIKNL